MTGVLGALLALPGVVFAGFGLYLLILALASASGRREQPVVAAPANRLVVIVPAHNEEQLVARCVTSLLAQSYPRALYRVVVIADNCSDGTGSIAAAAGAEVMVRSEADALGKGRALRWATDQLLAAPDRPDAVVVVDADSVADPNLLSVLEAELGRLPAKGGTPVETAAFADLRATLLISARDPRAPEAALDAARKLLALHKLQAASDVLLDFIGAGFQDREAQRLLIEVDCELGRRDVAREKCQLLGTAYRLDGKHSVADDVERLARIL